MNFNYWHPSPRPAFNPFYLLHAPYIRNTERYPAFDVRPFFNKNRIQRRPRVKFNRRKCSYLLPTTIRISTPKVKTFLEAYPTKTLTTSHLQAMLPTHWVMSTTEFLTEVKRIFVPRDSLEFYHVAQKFQAPIIAVERIENPYLYLMYRLKAEDCKLLFNSTELNLFHGTSIMKIDSIIKNNFDYRLAGSCVGHVHGKGVYFSSNPFGCVRYSFWNGKCERCMVMASVQQGKVFRGNEQLVIPPEDYDTSGNKHIFAKYYDHQFYPQYLIYY
jgi:Poly(ADP-ribose) polymerase catalytic domain